MVMGAGRDPPRGTARALLVELERLFGGMAGGVYKEYFFRFLHYCILNGFHHHRRVFENHD